MSSIHEKLDKLIDEVKALRRKVDELENREVIVIPGHEQTKDVSPYSPMRPIKLTCDA